MAASDSSVLADIDEFDEPAPIEVMFCPAISQEEYEEQTATETEKALQELMSYIDQNPDVYKKVLQRRKQENTEQLGMMSFLKVRLMSMFNGGVHPGSAVSPAELDAKVAQLKTGMTKVFDYSQEAKGRRTSKRLAEKRATSRVEQDENCPIPVAHVMPRNSCPAAPPPPPPCPPDQPLTPMSRLIRTPMRDTNSQTTTAPPDSIGKPLKTHVTRALGSGVRASSTSSLSSLTSQLNSSNPMKRLRSTGQSKSPGGTPIRRRKMSRQASRSSTASCDFADSLSINFMNVLEHKFRNVRSPSPLGRFSNASSPVTSFNNAVEFTP